MHPADDPNTPPEQLAGLLATHPLQVLANPAFPLLFLENSGWLEELAPSRGITRLLNEPTLPEYVAAHLTRSKKLYVRTNAQMHVALGEASDGWEGEAARAVAALSCPKADREQLFQCGLVPAWLAPFLPPQPAPKKALVEKPLSEKEKRRIAALSLEERRMMALRARRPEILRFLGEIADLTLLRWVCENAQTPTDVLVRLADNPDLHHYLVLNPRTPAEALEKILAAMNPEANARAWQLVWHPGLTPALAAVLKDRFSITVERFLPLPEFLERIAKNKTTRQNTLNILRRDDVPLWLKGEAVMEGCTSRSVYLPWFCGLLATESPKRLTDAARSDAWFTRFVVTLHPLSTEKNLQRLNHDANRYVRAAARARLADPRWMFQPDRAVG